MSRRIYPFDQSTPHDIPMDSTEERVTALTIDQLENGLLTLHKRETDRREFWADNEPAFRETVRVAIRETSDALNLKDLPAALRDELEGQLAWLQVYLNPQPLTLN